MVRIKVSNKNGNVYEWEIDGDKYDALAVCGDYVVFPAFKEKDACLLLDSDGDLTLIHDDEKIDFNLDDYGVFIYNGKWERILDVHNNYVIEIDGDVKYRIKYKWYGLTLVVKVTPIANTCQ